MEAGIAVDAPSVYVDTPATAGRLGDRTLVVTGEVVGSAVATEGGSTALAGGMTEVAVLATHG